ncbi:MAG: thermonuclease family protein, partial [Actinobacteria bacterium]
FNLDLVEHGYAVVETVPPDVAHVEDFVAAQRAARASHLGLWLKCALR